MHHHHHLAAPPQRPSATLWRHLAAAALALLLAACGGGSSDPCGLSFTCNSGDNTSTGGSTSSSGNSATSSASVSLTVSSATVTPAVPATVTVTLRDGSGRPIAGKVVDLRTARGNLATLSVSSVATDASGSATATVSAAAGGLSGADEVVGIAQLGTTTVQGSVAFTVQGAVPTASLSLSSQTLSASTGAATLRAQIRDAAGAPVVGVAVAFAAAGNRVVVTPASALTDGFGVATTSVAVKDASLSIADTVSATTQVGTVTVSSSIPLQLLADSPAIAVSAAAGSSSTVSAARPATLAVSVRKTDGTPAAAGTIVNVTSTFGLTNFSASPLSTDVNGIATVVVSPRTTTSSGSDQVVVAATVGGVAVAGSMVVQVASSSSASPPVLSTALSSVSVSSATPATVTATLTDGNGTAVPSQVVTFVVRRGLASTNIGTALTDDQGRAVVVLSPVNSTVAGADEVSASASYAGTALQSTAGFQIQATDVTLGTLTADVATVAPYGQTSLKLTMTGASIGAPVNVSVTSSCVALGKATLSPSTFTTTTNSVTLQYKDNGCGALQTADKLQAAIVGKSGFLALDLPIASPAVTSLAFVSASPEVIYIRGSGFTESSTVTFELRDAAGNVLPNKAVLLELLTEAGGASLEGAVRPGAGIPTQITQQSDAAGRVSALIKAGTQPTPIRVRASLVGSNPLISTVSSNLGIAVGLPSQLNFSMSQKAPNVEGMDVDGFVNTYTIIASDRVGNPVPAGTSINFVTEAGQVEAIRRTEMVNGLGSATANYQTAGPRPQDGRVTVTAYALGEESFIDQNGNNVYDPGEPFQELGAVYKDRILDGVFDGSVDEYVPTDIDDRATCLALSATPAWTQGGLGRTVQTDALLALDPTIPSTGNALNRGNGGSCDGKWSGAGQVYVRRAVLTVLSTSSARVLYRNASSNFDLLPTCSSVKLRLRSTLQEAPGEDGSFVPLDGNSIVYMAVNGVPKAGTLSFIAADNNIYPSNYPYRRNALGRFNPLAAGTVISATTSTQGMTVSIAGDVVPSTTEPSVFAMSVSFGLTYNPTQDGVALISVRSPSGIITPYAVNIITSTNKPSSCSPP